MSSIEILCKIPLFSNTGMSLYSAPISWGKTIFYTFGLIHFSESMYWYAVMISALCDVTKEMQYLSQVSVNSHNQVSSADCKLEGEIYWT